MHSVIQFVCLFFLKMEMLQSVVRKERCDGVEDVRKALPSRVLRACRRVVEGLNGVLD